MQAQAQAQAEAAATGGEGRIWLAATAHGDVQALGQNVGQEQYAKINQRFALRCKLSNDDIGRVVEERLPRKTQPRPRRPRSPPCKRCGWRSSARCTN